MKNGSNFLHPVSIWAVQNGCMRQNGIERLGFVCQMPILTLKLREELFCYCSSLLHGCVVIPRMSIVQARPFVDFALTENAPAELDLRVENDLIRVSATVSAACLVLRFVFHRPG